MDLYAVLKELKKQKEAVDDAIAVLEKVAREQSRAREAKEPSGPAAGGAKKPRRKKPGRPKR